jgi:hypothetical protein
MGPFHLSGYGVYQDLTHMFPFVDLPSVPNLR